MSGSLNKVTLIGYLGADPEVRTFQNGGRVVTFSVATSESWKDANSGERRERTEWHRVSVLNEGLGLLAEKFLTKGSRVYLEGQIRTRKWQDQSGADRYSTEISLTPYNGTITFLDSKPEEGRASGRGARSAAPRPEQATVGAGSGGGYKPGSDLDDEVPF